MSMTGETVNYWHQLSADDVLQRLGTDAIQGLSEASHELKNSAAEQNRVLMHLMQTMGQPVISQEEIAPPLEPAAPEPKEEISEPADKRAGGPFPPGCVKSRQTSRKVATKASSLHQV